MRTRMLITGTMAGAIMLLAASSVFAQTTIGFKVGVSVSRMSFDPSVNDVYVDAFGFDSAKALGGYGPVAGLVFRTRLRGMARLQVEGLFSRTGVGFDAKSGDFTSKRTIKMNWLEVPVLVSVPLDSAEKVEIQAGIFMMFKGGQIEHVVETVAGVRVTDRKITGDDRTKIGDTDFGIAVGATYAINDMVAVGGRFNFGVKNLQNEYVPIFNTLQSRNVSAFATFGFGGK